jgi:hypothetical protein
MYAFCRLNLVGRAEDNSNVTSGVKFIFFTLTKFLINKGGERPVKWLIYSNCFLSN